MAVSKVILNGVTLIDTTDKTVAADKLLDGYTALKNDGTTVTGNITSGSATTPATTITANPTISVSSSGLITASVSGSKSVTPSVSAGYVSSGTAGTVSVSGSNTQQLSTQAAQTITPTTTNQTIASGNYLTGNQTIEGIVCTNLTAENIADGVTVKIGTATDDDSVASITGTHSGGGGSTTLVHISFGVGVGSFVYYVDSNNEIQQWSTGQPLEDSFEKYCISGSMLVFLCKKQTSIVSSVTNATLVDSVDWSSGTYRCLEVYQVD